MKLFLTKHTILLSFNDDCFLIYQSATRKGLIVEKSFTIEDFSNIKEANVYFVSRKQIEEDEFKKLWKVMLESDYDIQRQISQRQGNSVQYEWWREEDAYLDGEKS